MKLYAQWQQKCANESAVAKVSKREMGDKRVSINMGKRGKREEPGGSGKMGKKAFCPELH